MENTLDTYIRGMIFQSKQYLHEERWDVGESHIWGS